MEGPEAWDLELITDLDASEIEAAVALWEACGLTRPWNDPRADARLALAGATSTILALREGGRVVATAMVGCDGHRGWVYYLGVDPMQRCRRVGEAMMQAAEAWVRARGAPKLQLMVRADNAGAQGFYDRLPARAGHGVVDAVRGRVRCGRWRCG